MKFLKMFFIFCFCLVVLSGCGNKDSDLLKGLSKKIDGLSSYHLSGALEIVNNENTYLYDVDVSFLKDNFFRVSLVNKSNNHEQIILRNSEGVYVLTPSLNKSFKFQSEWPYNNSQSYLLHSILNDINSDSDRVIEYNDDSYIITVKAQYTNNDELIKQKIYIDKDKNIKCVEVLDSSDIVKMKMSFNDIDYNYKYDEADFKLENNMTVFSDFSDYKGSIDDVLYPMYIPKNTFLSSQNKVSIPDGERVIMTFSGDSPFMIIEETLGSSDSMLFVSGDPFQLVDSVAVMDETSITWISDGIEYYLVSNSLDQQQLIDVANSMTVASIVK